LKVHTGQRYYFANLEIEVVTTYEDLNPHRINNQNDTNTVLRFTFTNNGAESYEMMWLGDANRYQSRFMCAMYGDNLKADLVQVAHHGNVGCENDLYNEINANAVYFPNSLSAYKSYMNPDNRKSTFCYDVDQTLIYDNPNTQYVYVSHEIHTTLPFSENGTPLYDQLFNTLAGPDAVIEYVTDVRNGGTAIKVR
jgi:hypothetical protein